MTDPVEPTPPAAARPAWLGRGVYRITVHVRDWSALRARLEEAVRAGYEADRFEVTTQEHPACWFLRGRRGFASGFTVALISRPVLTGGADVIVGVGRGSKLDDRGIQFATAFGVLAFVASALSIGFLQLPVVESWVVILAVTAAAAVAAYQLQLPAVAMYERARGGRLTDDEMGVLVEIVRAAMEQVTGVPAPERRA